MTKRHYELVAERVRKRLLIITSSLPPTNDTCIIASAMLKNLARDLADDFSAADRSFDRMRFLVLCGLTHQEINLHREVME